MRVLLLAQWFSPEPNFKGLNFAKALVQRGHTVQVLTGFPNYPGGKLYPGYRVRFLQRETLQGIPVIRVPLYPSHDNSAIRRFLNYISFALSAAVLGTLTVRKADVMYVYHPPATVALAAIVIGKMRRIPFVYDVQDLWPDTLRATKMVNSEFIIRLVGWWSALTYRMASRIVVLSPGFKTTLIDRGVPGEKISVIYNWCDEQALLKECGQAAPCGDGPLSGRFNIVFAGTMGKAQGLDTVLEAARLVRDRESEIQFVFVGGGVDVDRLKQKAAEERITNVLFLPRRPVSEIGEILKRADVLLVHLIKDPLFRITIPSKIQAYLAVGRPILVGVEGDAAELVVRAKAGVVYDPASPNSLAEATERLHALPRADLEEMGRNGKEFYAEQLALGIGVQRFEELFQSVGGPPGFASTRPEPAL